jgi:predicted O-methyltransferase YrrM
MNKKQKKLINERLQELEKLDQSKDIRDTLKRHWKIKEKKTLLWQIKPKTAKKLYNLVKIHKPKTILELGTSAGYSALVMMSANPCAKMHTIECIPYRIDMAKESFWKTKIKNRIIIYEDKIKNVLDMWQKTKKWKKNKIDLAFIDADKEYYEENTKKIMPFLSKNAIIVTDNVLDNIKKTQNYIKYMKMQKEYKTRIYSIDNGVLVAKRI